MNCQKAIMPIWKKPEAVSDTDDSILSNRKAAGQYPAAFLFSIKFFVIMRAPAQLSYHRLPWTLHILNGLCPMDPNTYYFGGFCLVHCNGSNHPVRKSLWRLHAASKISPFFCRQMVWSPVDQTCFPFEAATVFCAMTPTSLWGT